MGREIDKSAGEVKELEGFEVFQSNGRRYINVNGFEVPLGYDCYVARRYLLAVATRGPWVHEALEEVSTYISPRSRLLCSCFLTQLAALQPHRASTSTWTGMTAKPCSTGASAR